MKIKEHTTQPNTIEDEGGKTKEIKHRIAFDDGAVLEFVERNIFDFGRVINPNYPIAPGLEPGGLVNCDEVGKLFFMDFHRSIYRAGEYEGEDAIEKDFAKWSLPEEYTLRTTTEPPMFPGWHGIEWYEVIGPDGEILSDGPHRARCMSEQGALHGAHWILRVQVVSHGGWSKVRNLTPHEEMAYRYIQKHGYYAGASVRMETGPEDAIDPTDRQEATLELACEEGIIPGAMPADL